MEGLTVIIWDLLTALFVALLFTLLLSVAFWGARGLSSGIVALFVFVFLAVWAGGIWLAPVPGRMGYLYFFPFIAIGILVILLVAALKPRHWGYRPPQNRAEAIQNAREEQEMGSAFNLFFWVLIIGLIIAVIIRYLTGPMSALY